MPKSNT